MPKQPRSPLPVKPFKTENFYSAVNKKTQEISILDQEEDEVAKIL